MTAELRAFGWSAAIHLLLAGALILASGRLAPPVCVSLVDLTLLPSPAACPAPAAPATVKATPPSLPPVSPAPRPAMVAPAAPPVPVKTVDATTAPAPVPEPVPVAAAEVALSPETEARASEQTGKEAAAGSVETDVPTADGRASASVAVGSPDAARERYLAQHFAYIRDLILKQLKYPLVARKKGWTGQAKVAFVVGEDGGVSEIRVLAGSGYGILDHNAVETIRRAAPFPPPPVAAEIVMPVTYRLN